MKDQNDLEREELLAERLRQLDEGDVASLGECAADLTEEQVEQLARAQRMLRILHRARDAEGSYTDNESANSSAGGQSTAGMLPDDTLGVSEARSDVDADAVERLGRFEIIRELGRGGFGVVLLARDPKLQREIALKLPRAEALLSDEAQQRFERESQAATILGHPAIVPIYEAGHAGIVQYIAYGYCPGESLAEWFQHHNREISPDLAARIVARLAAAVQHAHSRGVVHRDLKPSNVLLDLHDDACGVTEDTLVEALRISDFGLAQLNEGTTNITHSGALLGTPAYMSPEQARGETTVGEPADIYALGGLLYELLTGEPPLRRATEIATLRAVELEQPPPVRSHSPAISRDLDAICLKCLEKDPRNRYGTAQELQDDLQRHLRQQPVIARPVGPLGRLNRWRRRNPLVAASLSTALAALVIGLAFSIVFGIRAERARKLADSQQLVADAKSAEALSQARLTRQAVDQLQRAIADEPAIHAQGMEKFKQKLVEASSDYYQLMSTQQPHDREVLLEYIDTLKGLAHLQQLLGEHGTSAALWRRVADILAQEFPEDRVGWAAVRSKLAEDLAVQGKINEAVEITSEIVNQLRLSAKESGSDKIVSNLIAQLVSSAQHINTQGDTDQANEIIDQAIDLVTSVTEVSPGHWPTHRIWARVLRCKCEIAWKRLDHDAVDQFAPIAIRLYQQLMTESPERTSESLDSMVSLHQVLGISNKMRNRMPESLSHFEQGATLQRQLMKRHPDVAFLSFNWSNHVHRHGQALFAAGQIEDAEELVKPHLDWLKAEQEKHPQLSFLLRISEVECRELMATIDQRQGRAVESLTQLDLAISIAEELCESEQAPLGLKAVRGNLLSRKAGILLENGEKERAIELLTGAITILEPLAGQPGGNEATTFLGVARGLLDRVQER